MKRKPLVSIIIPVYNRENIVEQSIQSALSQTYKNIEIIVIDNKSTDGTYEKICKLYEGNDLIRLYQNDFNIGPVRNWEKGLRYARGKYIKFLFSDDLLNEEFIQKSVSLLEKYQNAAFAISSVMFFNKFPCFDLNVSENYMNRGYNKKYACIKIRGSETAYQFGKREFVNKKVFYKRSFTTTAIGNVPVSLSCALFRKKDIKMKHEFGSHSFPFLMTGAGVDQYIFLHALNSYDGFAYIREPLCFFRVHSDSITIKNPGIKKGYDIARSYFLSREMKEKKSLYLSGNLAKIIIESGKSRNINVEKLANLYYGNSKVSLHTGRILLLVCSSRIKKRIRDSRLLHLIKHIEIDVGRRK